MEGSLVLRGLGELIMVRSEKVCSISLALGGAVHAFLILFIVQLFGLLILTYTAVLFMV